MKPQSPHGMLVQSSHDEASLESCVASMRKYFTAELVPGNRTLFETRLKPKFIAEHGREPNAAEIAALMDGTFYYRAASLIGRATQELLWDTVGEAIDRQLDEMIQKARPKGNPMGSLVLHPELPMPKYIRDVDIHVMPGNFQTELAEDDVLAGALYDRGGYVFAYGSRGPYNDNLGIIVAKMIKAWFPDFKPRRILEMGCGVGASTLPLKAAWPEADVYAIDIGAPMVRYAHARAESLGVPIHYSQQDACHTDFPDGQFDLVVSILVNHEQPVEVWQQMLKESHRLLAPGGISLHDGALKGAKAPRDAFGDFIGGWFGRNINEPYGLGQDMERDFALAGFDPGSLFSGIPEGDNYLAGHLAGHSYVGAVKR